MLLLHVLFAFCSNKYTTTVSQQTSDTYYTVATPIHLTDAGK